MDTFDLIKRNLKARDVHFYESPEHSELLAVFPIAGRRVEVRVIVEERGDFLLIRAGHLFQCQSSHLRFKEVAEVLLAANHEFRFVKAALDPSDGEVIVSGESWVRGGSLNDRSFETMFHAVVSVTEKIIKRVDDALGKDGRSPFEC